MNRQEALDTLRSHLPLLDAAAIPTKCEVFAICGPEARRLHDAILLITLGAPSSGGQHTPVVGLWKNQGLSRLERVRAHRMEFGSGLREAIEAVDTEADRQALIAKAEALPTPSQDAA